MIDERAIRKRYTAIRDQVDERGRRLFAAAEARAVGRGGIAAARTTPAGPARYSPLAIETSLTPRVMFDLALRQTEGLVGSILELMDFDLPVPDHSTLSRRTRTLGVAPAARTTARPLHLLVDSTGLK